MKILVTGATGFLGSHLVKALLKEGYEVLIFKRSTSNCTRIINELPSLTVFDLDKTNIRDVFHNYMIDAIIHCATCYGRNNEPNDEIIKTNLIFPLDLLEIANASNTKFFFNTDTFSRISIGDYLTGYHLTKEGFLEWAKHLTRQSNITFINMRLEHLYGPNDSNQKFVPNIIRSCLQNEPEILLTAGHQERDFVYINDVVSAFLLLLKKISKENLIVHEYQVGTGQPTSVRSFVTLVHQLTNSKSILKFGSLPYYKKEIMCSHADIKALTSLGWNNKTSLQQGIQEMIKEYYSTS